MTYQSEQDGQQRESSSDRVEDHGVGKVLENVGTLSVTAHQKERISEFAPQKKKQTKTAERRLTLHRRRSNWACNPT